jgi:hypothetical protein
LTYFGPGIWSSKFVDMHFGIYGYSVRVNLMKKMLLAGIAALLMATSAAQARPVSKSQSWKLIQGTWCVGDHPSDNEAYAGIARDKCGENEETLIIRENEYRWEREDGLSCRYLSGKARLDNTIPASTKTVGVWVFHIIAGCIRRPAEGAIGKYTQSFDMYVSKGTLWIENLRSAEKP